jgi:nucleoside-diphosphate-sugar epimerase
VGGDGTPYRSYLYAADLAIWLWTLLLRGRAGCAYNVGSDFDVTISQLAQAVAEVVSPQAKIEIANKPDPTRPPERYVPSIQKACLELGLEPWIDLREGIRRMAQWNRAQAL